MALKDSYNTNDDSARSIYGSNWEAQTFTPASSYSIGSVKLKLYKSGNPGTFTVSIRATSSGEPTGNDLASGTTDADTLTTDSSGEWREITFGSSYSLNNGTQYAIVCRATSGNSSNRTYWRGDSSSPTYSGGTLVISSNSGSSWTVASTYDLMFETYDAVTTHSCIGTSGFSSSVSGSLTGDWLLIGTSEISSNVIVSLTVTELHELVGTCTSNSSLIGELTTHTYQSGEGIITVVSSVSAIMAEIVKNYSSTQKRRLVVAGNDSVYYENL